MTKTYSPYINHFIQPDSIIPNPANPQSLNRYSYANNNPLNYTDPTGHFQQVANSSTCLGDHCATVEELDGLYKKGQEDKKWKEENGCVWVSPMGICTGPGGDYVQNERNDTEAEDALRYTENTVIAVTAVYTGVTCFGPGLCADLAYQGFNRLAVGCLRLTLCAKLIGVEAGVTVLGKSFAGEETPRYARIGRLLENARVLWGPGWNPQKQYDFMSETLSSGQPVFLANNYENFPGSILYEEVTTLLENGWTMVLNTFIYPPPTP